MKILTEANAVPSEWAVDNYEDPYPEDAPAMVPETAANTATAVGLWLARNAPVHVSGENGGVTCFPPGKLTRMRTHKSRGISNNGKREQGFGDHRPVSRTPAACDFTL